MTLFYFKSQKYNKLSPYFTIAELQCKCQDCNLQIIDDKLLYKLDVLREAVAKPIYINCAYRCEKHNKEVGGVESSQHILGKAADIRCEGISLDELERLCCLVGFTGVGRYSAFIHVDVREGKQIRFVGGY